MVPGVRDGREVEVRMDLRTWDAPVSYAMFDCLILTTVSTPLGETKPSR
jgi:hypothetical protein